jgi:putative ABC transport system permease protein
MHHLAQDIRFGARLLLKNRVFTAAAVASLALGIGAATTVFTVIYAMNLRALPFAEPRRIVTVLGADAHGGRRDPPYELFRQWQDGRTGFSGLAAWRSASMNLADDDRAPDRFNGTFVTASAFSLLGEQPVLGRDFRPEDDRPGARPVILLGYGPWTDRYGADPTIVGRTIRVNGVPAVVIGVMPEGFRFPYQSDVWQPLSDMAADGRGLGGTDVAVFGRLQQGTTIAQAAASLAAFGATWSSPTEASTEQDRPVIISLDERFLGESTDLWSIVAAIAACLVLLIACANVANLLLARAGSRSREISVRAALGAGRGRIVRQLLVESLTLTTVAAIVGLGLAASGVHMFRLEVADLILPYWTRFDFDGHVFTFVAAVCLGTTLMFGMAPALHLSRPNINDVLGEAGRGGMSGARAKRSTQALLVAELALTTVVLSAATLMVQSGLTLSRADQVVDSAGLWTMRLALPARHYATADRRSVFYRRLEERLAALPAATSAALSTALPFAAAERMQLMIEGDEPVRDSRPLVSVVSIGPRYFETLGVRLLRGRAFTVVDGARGREAAIVNERFAARFGAGREILGRRVRLMSRRGPAGEPPWITIVGVVPSVRQNPEGAAQPVVYLPFGAGAPLTAAIIVRAQGASLAFVGALREDVRAIDPDLPLYDLQPLQRISQASRWPQRVFGTVLSVFGGISLALAALGLFAVTAYGVARRTPEIGIRMALGARAGQVVGMFLRSTVVLLAIGLAIGLAGALALGSAMRAVLIGTRPTDPATLGGVAAFLATVGVLSTWLSARRAARIDPMVTLRHE